MGGASLLDMGKPASWPPSIVPSPEVTWPLQVDEDEKRSFKMPQARIPSWRSPLESLPPNRALQPCCTQCDSLLSVTGFLATARSLGQLRHGCLGLGSPGLTHGDRRSTHVLTHSGGSRTQPMATLSSGKCQSCSPNPADSQCPLTGSEVREGRLAAGRRACGPLGDCHTGSQMNTRLTVLSSRRTSEEVTSRQERGHWPASERASPKSGQDARGPRQRLCPGHRKGPMAVTVQGEQAGEYVGSSQAPERLHMAPGSADQAGTPATRTCALARPLAPFTCTGLVVVEYWVLGSWGQWGTACVLGPGEAGAERGRLRGQPRGGEAAATLCCGRKLGVFREPSSFFCRGRAINRGCI